MNNVQTETVIMDTTGMTEGQKAVVVTAESFYLRGEYAQYDMGTLYVGEDGTELCRRLTGEKAPEDYTSQHTGYTDCSGFVYDVYIAALGKKITEGSVWTKPFCESLENTVLRVFPPQIASEEEKEAKLKEFVDTLQPGDIIVYRYKGNTSGHALLYVGDGMIVHSGGKSFDYKNGVEIYEEKGTFYYQPVSETFFNPEHRLYLLNKPVYVIVRPLDSFKEQIPEHTLSRMNQMRGVFAEKIASHTHGQTVNPNDEITFTFKLVNHSDAVKNLVITDALPENTIYLSGAQKKDGNNLRWELELPAKQSVEVSYKVKVMPDTYGKEIVSNSYVSDIKVNCPAILVAKTLTECQQEEIKNAVERFENSDKNGLELANQIYGKNIFKMNSSQDLWDALIDPKSSTMGKDLPLSGMVVPHLYGGRQIGELDFNSLDARKRVRRVRDVLLVIGDIIAKDEELYLFVGDGLFDLNGKVKVEASILENILAAQRFAVLRPSLKF